MSSQMALNKIFPIVTKFEVMSCLKIECEDTTYIWHCRYSHLSLQGL